MAHSYTTCGDVTFKVTGGADETRFCCRLPYAAASSDSSSRVGACWSRRSLRR